MDQIENESLQYINVENQTKNEIFVYFSKVNFRKND